MHLVIIFKSVTGLFRIINCKVSYPVGSQLDQVWVAIEILAKVGMGDTATEGVAILDYHKIVNRRIGQSLLQTVREYRVYAGSKGVDLTAAATPAIPPPLQ